MTTKYLLLLLYSAMLIAFQVFKKTYAKTKNKTHYIIANVLRFASLGIIVLLLKYI